MAYALRIISFLLGAMLNPASVITKGLLFEEAHPETNQEEQP